MPALLSVPFLLWSFRAAEKGKRKARARPVPSANLSPPPRLPPAPPYQACPLPTAPATPDFTLPGVCTFLSAPPLSHCLAWPFPTSTFAYANPIHRCSAPQAAPSPGRLLTTQSPCLPCHLQSWALRNLNFLRLPWRAARRLWAIIPEPQLPPLEDGGGMALWVVIRTRNLESTRRSGVRQQASTPCLSLWLPCRLRLPS